MRSPAPEHKRTHISYGCHPDTSKQKDSVLNSLAAFHPFTHQLDIVVPASPGLQDRLIQLSTQYYERQWKLSEFAAFAETHVQKFSEESDMIALGKPSHLEDDVWCLDTRGVLTLSVSKTTYECLGLIGKALPWKEHQHTFVIRISLRSQAPALREERCHAYDARVKSALEAWDQRRGPWDVVFHVPEAPPDGAYQVHKVASEARTQRDVHIPKPTLCLRPTGDSCEKEEWDESAAELFEWVGMACLGSERLRTNDKPDPYVSVYTPPEAAYSGDLVHIRWKGLLAPAFVQSVIDIAKEASLAGIVGNSIHVSPVVYLPPPASMRYPLRATRDDTEDCWSLVIARSQESEELNWLLAESIGRWDNRWG